MHMYFLLRAMQIDPFEMLHGGPLNPVSLLLFFGHLFQTIVLFCFKKKTQNTLMVVSQNEQRFWTELIPVLQSMKV